MSQVTSKPKLKNKPRVEELAKNWRFNPKRYPSIEGNEISFAHCFKIEKENAKAMIEGFKKEGKRLQQCIYCLGRSMPAGLIILNKHPSRFELSRIGLNLDAENYEIENKYVAHQVKSYKIINVSELWHKLCSNGLFDIWEPIAPFNKYNENADPSNFSISLLRVYELEEPVPDEFVTINDRNASLKCPIQAKIKKPIVTDKDFKEIKEKLENALKEVINQKHRELKSKR